MTTSELTHTTHTAHRRSLLLPRELREGALDMAPLAAGYAPFAFAIGAAAGASRDPLAACSGSLLMFGGSAQLLVIGLVGSGAGLWAAVAAAVVFNARLLVFSATLTPVWKGTSVPRRLIAAAVVGGPGHPGSRGRRVGGAGLAGRLRPPRRHGRGRAGRRGSSTAEGELTMWAAILLAGLASYVLRVVPLLVLGRVELPPRLSEALQHAAMGAMAVMVVTGAAHAAGAVGAVAHTGIPQTVTVLGRTIGVVAGVGTALVMGLRGRSMPAAVAAATAAFALVCGLAEGAAAVLATHA